MKSVLVFAASGLVLYHKQWILPQAAYTAGSGTERMLGGLLRAMLELASTATGGAVLRFIELGDTCVYLARQGDLFCALLYERDVSPAHREATITFGRLLAEKILASFVNEFGAEVSGAYGHALSTYRVFSLRATAQVRDVLRAAIAQRLPAVTPGLEAAYLLGDDGLTESFIVPVEASSGPGLADGTAAAASEGPLLGPTDLLSGALTRMAAAAALSAPASAAAGMPASVAAAPRPAPRHVPIVGLPVPAIPTFSLRRSSTQAAPVMAALAAASAARSQPAAATAAAAIGSQSAMSGSLAVFPPPDRRIGPSASATGRQRSASLSLPGPSGLSLSLAQPALGGSAVGTSGVSSYFIPSRSPPSQVEAGSAVTASDAAVVMISPQQLRVQLADPTIAAPDPLAVTAPPSRSEPLLASHDASLFPPPPTQAAAAPAVGTSGIPRFRYHSGAVRREGDALLLLADTRPFLTAASAMLATIGAGANSISAGVAAAHHHDDAHAATGSHGGPSRHTHGGGHLFAGGHAPPSQAASAGPSAAGSSHWHSGATGAGTYTAHAAVPSRVHAFSQASMTTGVGVRVLLFRLAGATLLLHVRPDVGEAAVRSTAEPTIVVIQRALLLLQRLRRSGGDGSAAVGLGIGAALAPGGLAAGFGLGGGLGGSAAGILAGAGGAGSGSGGGAGLAAALGISDPDLAFGWDSFA